MMRVNKRPCTVGGVYGDVVKHNNKTPQKYIYNHTQLPSAINHKRHFTDTHINIKQPAIQGLGTLGLSFTPIELNMYRDAYIYIIIYYSRFACGLYIATHTHTHTSNKIPYICLIKQLQIYIWSLYITLYKK